MLQIILETLKQRIELCIGILIAQPGESMIAAKLQIGQMQYGERGFRRH